MNYKRKDIHTKMLTPEPILAEDWIYYKYRLFDDSGFWKKLIIGGSLWFSHPDPLDDQDEVRYTYEYAFLGNLHWEDETRNLTTILSLGQSPVNDRLWSDYAGHGYNGFCVELNLNNLSHDDDIFRDKITYTDDRATAHFDMNTFFAYKRNPEEVIDQAWKKLFLTKSRQKWEMQNEIRILKLNRDFANFPKGLEVQIPVNCIRRIFIKSNLSQQNYDLLKIAVNEVRSKWNYDLNIIKI